MILKKTALAITAASLMAGAAMAQSPSPADPEFITKAAVGNTFEIEQAKLALEKAADPKVKEFAEMMIKDHTDAFNKLKEAAKGASVEMKLDEPHQAMIDNIKTYSGAEFDKIYKADQIMAHVETEALLLDYEANGQTEALKDWAEEVLPHVQHHKAIVSAM